LSDPALARRRTQRSLRRHRRARELPGRSARPARPADHRAGRRRDPRPRSGPADRQPRMRRGPAFAVAVLLWALPCAPALAAAPAPKVSISEIEAEVMCPVCGTLLELADSPQARREKAYVARLIAAGRTRAQIKDALVAQYGDAVLALPKASG